jgi:hypothetical protein
MDEKMNFSEHIDVMVGKAFAMLGFIRSSEAGIRQLYMEPILLRAFG